MSGSNEFLMVLGIGIGLGTVLVITLWVVSLTGFLADIYKEWHEGRQLAQLVAEKNHKRRVELLAQMIELKQAMQPVLSEEPVIESQERVVNDLAACQRNGVPDGEGDAGGGAE